MKTTATVEMNNMRSNRNEAGHVFSAPNALAGLSHRLSQMAGLLAALFSFILGERVGSAYSLCLLNVMISGLCAFLFGGAGVCIQVLLLVWLGVAVWQARTVSRV